MSNADSDLSSDVCLTDSLDLSIPANYYIRGTRRHRRHGDGYSSLPRRDVSSGLSVWHQGATQRQNGDGVSILIEKTGSCASLS